jgi:rho GTPase-activating protein, putative
VLNKASSLELKFFYFFFFAFTEAFGGITSTKTFCQYQKESRRFTMIPYNQTVGKIVCCSYLESAFVLFFSHYYFKLIVVISDDY